MNDDLSFPIEKKKEVDLKGFLGKEVLLGIRPENINEKNDKESIKTKVKIDIVEPLGMETMVYFSINKVQLCGKVSPDNDLRDGTIIPLYFSKDSFYIIDPLTDKVL